MTDQPNAAAAALRQAAAAALLAAEHLARAVASARTAGIVVDTEVFEASATVFSWAAWLAGRAQDPPPATPHDWPGKDQP